MTDIDQKHKENLKNFDEIKEIFAVHDKMDKDFQKKSTDTFGIIEEQLQRMEPMIKVFENKKIAKMVFDEETKTITFYIKTLTTWGIFLTGIWTIIKVFFLKTTI